MIFFRKPVATFRDRALADSHKADAQFPSPLVGEDRLGRRPSEEGGAGHRAPGRSRPAVHQPQGQGPRDPSGPAPAADGLQSLVGKVLHARRPLLARPSAESVLPTRGRRRARPARSLISAGQSAGPQTLLKRSSVPSESGPGERSLGPKRSAPRRRG